MRWKSKKCTRLWKRAGLTLIEVLMATILMATLMVGLLVAFQRHRSQIKFAYEKHQALEFLDELLTGWFSNDDRLPDFPCRGVAAEDLEWSAAVINWTPFGTAGLIPQIEISVISLEYSPPKTLASIHIFAHPNSNQTLNPK